MSLIKGLTASVGPGPTTALLGDTLVVNAPSARFADLVVQCQVVSVSGPVIHPVPKSVSISPNPFAFTTQGQTQPFVATVKDQFGNIFPGATVTWASNIGAVTINSSTGVGTAVQTGGNGVLTATVQGTGITNTATVQTPAPIPTTLTLSAGYATLAAAANAFGTTIGFSVNDSYEAHSNYAQNYTQAANGGGAGGDARRLREVP